uniref:Cadherin domain-containing protein n=1 Tax=Elaeophora elaphi TaxID=1147741 RepID=A0A0R3RGW6_9BILA
LQPRKFIVRSDASLGWLISDLIEDGYCRWDDHCILSTSNQSHYFQIVDNRLCIKNSIRQLQDRSVAIIIETAAPQQRIFTVNVNITGNSSPSFSSDIYNATLRNDVAPETAVSFDKEITLINVSNSTDLHISIISNSTNLPFILNYRKRRDAHYAKLYISRRLRPTDGTFQSFYIGALDKHSLIRLAVARIDISLEELPISAPKFNSAHYFRQVDKLQPHATVLRVTAK